MTLRVVRADPAGNITLFVLDPVEKSLRPRIAKRLMEELTADQVGFRCQPEPGTDGCMEMAGGEFCGNATRAYAMLTAREKGLEGRREITLRVSGCDFPVTASIDTVKGTASSRMPLPRTVGQVSVDGVLCTLVRAGDIVHGVVRGTEPSEEFFLKAEKHIAGMEGSEAYGVIFLSRDGRSLRPLVKVPAVGSLVWEGSCGSGALACAAAECEGRPDGDYSFSYAQPAGEITAGISIRRGETVQASIGGSVALDDPVTVDIEI